MWSYCRMNSQYLRKKTHLEKKLLWRFRISLIYAWSYCPAKQWCFHQKQANSSSAPVKEEMMIPYMNTIKPSKFRSQNVRTKTNMKSHFSGLTSKINLIYLLWKPKLPKSTFNSKPFFTKSSTENKKLSFVKAHLWQRY